MMKMMNRSVFLVVAGLGIASGCALDPGEGDAAAADPADQASALTAPGVVYETGFEAGLTGLKKHAVLGATIEPVRAPVASGRFSGKYDLVRTVGQDTYRAETYVEKGSFEFNTEYWFTMKYMYENWDKDRSAEIGPFQVHRVPSAWKAGCGGEVSAYSAAPFLMFSQNDVAQIITSGGVVSWSGPVVKHKWQDIVFHFKITWDKTGYVEAWKDGVKLFRRTGALHKRIDDCGQPFKSPSFNIGVYKWDWKANRSATDSSRRTLYIDDLKITRGNLPLLGS